jgi:hypothetical protein
MTRRITHLIEEQKNRINPSSTKDPDIKVPRTLEEPQRIEVPILDKENLLPLNPRKESQHREVTMSKEDKNHNEKRNTEMKLTGKKARKISKKRASIEKLHKGPERTLQEGNLQNRSFVGISKQ